MQFIVFLVKRQMRLKDYQVVALDSFSTYLRLLSNESQKRADELMHIEQLPAATRERVRAVLGDPVADAWKVAQESGVAASPEDWHELRDGTGRSIPHVCLKLPTGGGKTLIAAHAVDRILVSHFKRTAGLVLWIVPSEAIYKQTKAQLTNRLHPIRQALDRASGGRVSILEKLDGFTKQDIEQKLCVLLIMLQAAGRQNRESLKLFRDAGQYMSFFPQDDPIARSALLKAVPNLEGIDLVEAATSPASVKWIKQSLGNTLRLIRPIIVLDEGHRAYSPLARGTLATFNPSFMLELSATPDRGQSNILVNVSGRALKDEEMIKLPIQLEVGRNRDWQDTLRDAVGRLNELEQEARKFETKSGRYIRPIMLIRVDRVGNDQRGKGRDLVHAEDAFEFLTQKCSVNPEAVRRQTSQVKELKDDDLSSPYCGVRFIITKDALREGWDCPFAYVLAILSKGTASTALTQMIGRVLRQPHAERTHLSNLDEAHVFCADVDVGNAVTRIKRGLESEGMGDIAGEIVLRDNTAKHEEIEVRFRKPFRGKQIMVPRVLHRQGKREFRELDYDADILATVDFNKLSYRKIDDFKLAAYDLAEKTSYTVDLSGGEEFDVDASTAKTTVAMEKPIELPSLVQRMLDVVPNPWQAARILNEALVKLRRRATGKEISTAILTLVDHVRSDLREQINAAAEHAFRKKVESGDIVFKLLAAPLEGLNFTFDEIFKTHVAYGDASAPLLNVGGTPLERALYDKVFKSDFNEFERNVALYVDTRDAVGWWWRIAARRDWGLQGWMRNKVYPDFLIQVDADQDTARLLVLETKGKHLEGSDDTEFKTKLFALLEEAYAIGKDVGQIELLAEAPESMRFRILLQEEAWKVDVESALN